MKAELHNYIDPKGVYTGVQVMALTEIPRTSFYRFVRQKKIPKHTRMIDGKTVFFGHELLRVLTATKEERRIPIVGMKFTRRGRPRKDNSEK